MSKIKSMALMVIIAATSAWAATITVTAPVAGAVLCKGRTYPVAWSCSGVSGPVMVWLMQGRIVAAYLTWSTENDGRFDFTVSDRLRAGDYTMAVISRNDRSVKGESGRFRIDPCTLTPAPPPPMEIAPQIIVTWPNETVTVKVNGIMDVKWTTRGRVPERVGISLHPRDCSGAGVALSHVSPNDGFTRVYIPTSVAAGDYCLRIGQFGSTVFGCSKTFHIRFEYAFIEPIRYSSWHPGDVMRVRWNSAMLGGVPVKMGVIEDFSDRPGNLHYYGRVTDSTPNDGEERITLLVDLPAGFYRIWLLTTGPTRGYYYDGAFSEPFQVNPR